jgi:hypothetical protein
MEHDLKHAWRYGAQSTSWLAAAAVVALGMSGAAWAQQTQAPQAGQGSATQTTPQAPGMPGSAGGMTPHQPGVQGSTQQQPQRMTEDQIRNALRARGYSEVSGMERDGDSFRIREAERYGEKVENLRVDARSGQVRDEQRLSEDQARRMLRDQGYSDISDVSRDGNTITAKAKRGDREVRLRIDANTGVVSQQQASN